MDRRRIKIIYTGGTIGSEPTESDILVPGSTLKKYLQKDIQELRNRDPKIDPRKEYIPDYDFEPLDQLLDSSNMGPNDWNKIAEAIAPVIIGEEMNRYSGVLILHGTDTMAYTASALSFMLEGLHHSQKAVVITGSQIPYYKARTDGRDQLISAMILTAFGEIPEVVLYFNGKALRGCRSTKFDSWGFGAFESPNFPPLGQFGIEFSEDEDLKLARQTKLFKRRIGFHNSQIHFLHENVETTPRIGVLKLYPGITVESFLNFANSLDAMVIEGFGSGNGPIDFSDREFLDAYETVVKEKIVVIVTQCVKGLVSMTYGTGLIYTGGVDGRDMTTEAALAKLHYLISKAKSRYWSMKDIKSSLSEDIVGELREQENLPSQKYNKDDLLLLLP